MRVPLLILTGIGLPASLLAQAHTGEIRVHAVAAYALRVSDTTGYGYLSGPPGGGAVAGVTADLSFIMGGLRIGPEASVLRGPERRVWSLGGVARYEIGRSAVRPFGLFGAGAYFWDREILITPDPGGGDPYPYWESDINYFTMSLGAGVTIGPSQGRYAFSAESRVHRSFQSGGGAGVRSMVSLGIGGRVAW